MNEVIKKFWEELGEVDLTPSAPIVYWVVKLSSNNQYLSIAQSQVDCNPKVTTYFYESVSYTESEMLRLIELKLFL